MAAVKLSDVAREAGVSPATASRVLNGSARTPAAEIAERVRAAAAALGYIPNAQAQALARSSSGLLGLVVHDIADPYFSSIARGVQAAARAHGKTLLLISTEGTPAEERDAVEAFASRRTDAIVMAGSRSLREADSADNDALAHAAARYEENGGTVVMVGSPLLPPTHDGGDAPPQPGSPGAGAESGPGSGAQVLEIPNEALAADLARELVGAGWSRFAVVAGPEGLVTSDLRLAGFRRGLREVGAPEAEVLRAAFNRAGGFGAAEALEALAGSGSGDGGAAGERLCVFAVNDRMAMGAVAGLRARGLSAPDDYGIAGFDDIDTLADFVPELTTVHLDLEQMGHDAASAALASGHTGARSAGSRGAGSHGGALPPAVGRVVVRASTAR
ncbi:LacI family transcriptional regulator [Sinomonas cyclohexanicum]|uniref:LacI family transcriptional regulator n=1 Tax=Sinomonas cyclohexanicum TaxID=322009 RepID=A0ABM7PQ24_SINCY|nr:LacI family DNA-binding transcriptional regulator [Corynebacterium cyclohexanicum]BCT74285.1 LacI family transcriptional regulator [Corynebacterium cyclohexanicum]